MSEDKVTAIIPENCPHCGKEILVHYSIEIPKIDRISKVEELKPEDRELLRANLDKFKFDNETDKQKFLDWLDGKAELETALLDKLLKQIYGESLPTEN